MCKPLVKNQLLREFDRITVVIQHADSNQVAEDLRIQMARIGWTLKSYNHVMSRKLSASGDKALCPEFFRKRKL